MTSHRLVVVPAAGIARRERIARPCAFCGARAVHRHHYTARAAGRTDYLDPGSTLPLCARCHATEHAGWRTGFVRMDQLDDPVLARVRRLTWTVGRLCDVGRGIDACDLRGFHDVLVAIQRDVRALVERTGGP